MHNVDVISANKGQSIATEVKNLKIVGKKINITKNNFSFIPVCSKEKIESHKKFLNNRIRNAKIDSNKDVIIDRYKRLFSKSLKIVLPEELQLNSDFIREFDYIFKFMTNLNKDMLILRENKIKKEMYIPLHFLKILNNKNKSVKNIFNNIEKLVVNQKKR